MTPTSPTPQVNGCYIAPSGDMLKVLSLNYREAKLESISVETVHGEIQQFSIEHWQSHYFLPCCFLGDSDLYEEGLEKQRVVTPQYEVSQRINEPY